MWMMKGVNMMSDTIKVTMNLTARDVKNTQKVKESLHARSNAAVISDALSVTTKLIDLSKKGNEILIRNKKGELERLIFANMELWLKKTHRHWGSAQASPSEPAKTGDPLKSGGTELAYHNDPQFYRTVAWFLGTTIILCTIGAILLAYCGKDIPDWLVALGSAAIGALAGLFASSKKWVKSTFLE